MQLFCTILRLDEAFSLIFFGWRLMFFSVPESALHRFRVVHSRSFFMRGTKHPGLCFPSIAF